MCTSFNPSRHSIRLRAPSNLGIWKLPFCPQCTSRLSELTAFNQRLFFVLKFMLQTVETRFKTRQISKHIETLITQTRPQIQHHPQVTRLTSHVQHYAVLVIPYNGGDSAVRSPFLSFRSHHVISTRVNAKQLGLSILLLASTFSIHTCPNIKCRQNHSNSTPV